MEGFTPARAADVTGIPAEGIRRLARELAGAPCAIVYGRAARTLERLLGADWRPATVGARVHVTAVVPEILRR